MAQALPAHARARTRPQFPTEAGPPLAQKRQWCGDAAILAMILEKRSNEIAAQAMATATATATAKVAVWKAQRER
ncbi:MAG: hypothetical protein LW719_01860 [Comamonadaceae bacterium]|nr:hypothetical protein [Comamonadaceae bacterium]